MISTERRNLIVGGSIIGVIAAMLVYFGNPMNMGYCIACFIRDTAGALGLHRAGVVQYIRPELIGLVFGSLGMAFFSKEFSDRGGSAPMTRFLLGFFVMVGCLVFLGCTFRMILRIAGGDWNALVGLVGFVAGIGVGILFLRRGYSLQRTVAMSRLEGLIFPALQIVFLALLLAAPAFIFFSEKGPGSQHVPIIISLIAGLIVGAIAQRTRFCTVGSFRNVILQKDSTMLSGFIAILVSAFIVNIILTQVTGTVYFHGGFDKQPIAHMDGLWNFLSMVLVGFGSVLMGGCPFRQMVLAGEGSTDSAITLLGFLVGGAFAHNFALASTASGPTPGGKIAVIVGLVCFAIIGFVNSKRA